METYYLIDYENVNSDGLSGCDKLAKSDHIIIFFTKNAMKIATLNRLTRVRRLSSGYI